MGLVDKVKQQATQVVEKAQEAGKVGQAKLEALQARRRADAALAELGAIAYRARTQQAKPGDEARAVELVAELRQYEAEHGALDGDGAASSS
jgi:hypothetical protein